MMIAVAEFVEFLAAGPSRSEVARFQVSDSAKTELHDLIRRSKTHGITSDERDDLGLALQVEHLMRLAKARAWQEMANPNEITMANHSPRFLKIVEDTRERVNECTIADVKPRVERGEKFHLVDVREESEYAAGHIPGAIHLGKGVIERDIESRIPDMNAQIILYCGGGFRSVLAADSLQKMGYTNVISMDGGWRAWKESGAAIAKP